MGIAGNWKITVKTPMGDQQSTLALVVDGTKLTGTQTSSFGVDQLTDGVVNGNTATWNAKMTSPFPMDLEVSAVVELDVTDDRPMTREGFHEPGFGRVGGLVEPDVISAGRREQLAGPLPVEAADARL